MGADRGTGGQRAAAHDPAQRQEGHGRVRPRARAGHVARGIRATAVLAARAPWPAGGEVRLWRLPVRCLHRSRRRSDPPVRWCSRLLRTIPRVRTWRRSTDWNVRKDPHPLQKAFTDEQAGSVRLLHQRHHHGRPRLAASAPGRGLQPRRAAERSAAFLSGEAPGADAQLKTTCAGAEPTSGSSRRSAPAAEEMVRERARIRNSEQGRGFLTGAGTLAVAFSFLGRVGDPRSRRRLGRLPGLRVDEQRRPPVRGWCSSPAAVAIHAGRSSSAPACRRR